MPIKKFNFSFSFNTQIKLRHVQYTVRVTCNLADSPVYLKDKIKVSFLTYEKIGGCRYVLNNVLCY